MEHYRILLVDDEEEIRQGIKQKIDWEGLGFVILDDAENGVEAWEKIVTLEPDIVLTDIRMPYMDGLTLTEQIREHGFDTEVVIFSGFDDFDYAKQAIRLGVIEYILKPVNMEELTRILKKLHDKMDEKLGRQRDMQMLQEQYRKLQPLLRESFLHDWICDRVTPQDLTEQLHRFSIDLRPGDRVAVAMTRINWQQSKTGEEDHELLALSVQNIMEERIGRQYRFVSQGHLGEHALILFLEKGNEIDTLMHQLSLACRACQRAMHTVVRVGLSGMSSDQAAIGTAYQEAKEALGYESAAGGQHVIYIRDVEGVPKGALVLQDKEEQALWQAIKFHSDEEIRRLIGELISHMEEAKLHSSHQQLYLLSIINSVMKLSLRHNVDMQQIWGREADYLETIESLMKAQNHQNFLTNLCISVGENINQDREENVKDSILEAKAYIQREYRNPELSVERVCDHLHMSQAYFSTLFKKETGQSYIQYVTELRLNRAIELLDTTDDKTYVIGNQVGYPEPNYFSYVFKKRFGVSPTKYRAK
ncbi:MAG: response regulator [Lachnospiraceae bacterium]|nr:response regulator [Lachnospiraceae bacterium]MDY5741990.1 response regulator [Lachnospiraceae bacterium]